MIISRSGDLTREDVIKWLQNTLLFLAPTLIVFLTSLAGVIPHEAGNGAFLLYVINVATDLLKKYVAENHYVDNRKKIR